MQHETSARLRWIRALDAVGLVATGFGTLLLLAFLLASFLLSGGVVVPTKDPLFEPLVPFPVVVIAPWLPIAIATVALVTFVPMAALVPPSEASRVIRALRLTGAGACILGLLTMFAFPEVVGLDRFGVELTQPGLHWIAIVIGAVAIVLMLLLAGRAISRHDRLRRSGVLADEMP